MTKSPRGIRCMPQMRSFVSTQACGKACGHVKTGRVCISTELMSQAWEKQSSPCATHHGHLHRQACHYRVVSGCSHRSLRHNAVMSCTRMCCVSWHVY